MLNAERLTFNSEVCRIANGVVQGFDCARLRALSIAEPAPRAQTVQAWVTVQTRLTVQAWVTVNTGLTVQASPQVGRRRPRLAAVMERAGSPAATRRYMAVHPCVRLGGTPSPHLHSRTFACISGPIPLLYIFEDEDEDEDDPTFRVPPTLHAPPVRPPLWPTDYPRS